MQCSSCEIVKILTLPFGNKFFDHSEHPCIVFPIYSVITVHSRTNCEERHSLSSKFSRFSVSNSCYCLDVVGFMWREHNRSQATVLST